MNTVAKDGRGPTAPANDGSLQVLLELSGKRLQAAARNWFLQQQIPPAFVERVRLHGSDDFREWTLTFHLRDGSELMHRLTVPERP